MQQCFDEGYQAFLNNVSLLDCPYIPFWQRKSWIDGWNASADDNIK